MRDWTIENDEGKRWRIVGPAGRWTMQPVGNIDVREAEDVCSLAVEGHRAGTEWFWRIVDANGVANLSSDERQAIRELVVMAARFDLVKHLFRQRAFSLKTFGPGARTKGVLDHIRKELIEIEADPSDLGEWVDLILLALDGAWRAGFTPEEIAQGLDAKQTRNEARDWPDWRTADLGRRPLHRPDARRDRRAASTGGLKWPTISFGRRSTIRSTETARRRIC